jgi:hypothetical protein
VATVQFQWYSQFLANEQGGTSAGTAYSVDFLSDTIKVALLAASYTPALDTHDFFNDITNEVVGTGYVAGGTTLANKQLSVVAANSWATARANSTAYSVGDIVRPAAGNGYLFRCVVAGTSGGSTPTYVTTIGRETVDGTVVWSCVGSAAVTFDADDAAWAGSTITARYAVVYKDTGTPATSPLMLLGTFSGEVSSTAGTFQIVFPATGFAAKIRG